MLFFKEKKNDVIDFVKEADVRIAEAYRRNEVRELKDVVTYDLYKTLRTDITCHQVNEEHKYEDERLMKRNYNIVEENDEVAVVKRDIKFKEIKCAGKRLLAGINFSELLTINKKDGYAISNIVAAY